MNYLEPGHGFLAVGFVARPLDGGRPVASVDQRAGRRRVVVVVRMVRMVVRMVSGPARARTQRLRFGHLAQLRRCRRPRRLSVRDRR